MSACIPADRLIQSVLVDVPGVTPDLINLKLFNIMDIFFRRTNAWKFDQEIDLSAGSNEYPLGTPGNAVVVRDLGATYNDMPVFNSAAGSSITQSSLVGIAPEMVFPDGDASFAPAESDLAANLFSYAIYAPSTVSVTVPDTQDIKYPLKISVALSVAKGCLECACGDWDVPEWMWDAYFQVWLDGTMSALYAMPAKPWSSPTLAQFYGKKAMNRASFHKQEARRGFSYDKQTWRFPRGWR